MRAQSKHIEIEYLQWCGCDPLENCLGPDKGCSANVVVQWVIDNGGEAFFDERATFSSEQQMISVHTNSGWAPVRPGWYVMKGSETFTVENGEDESGPCYRSVLDHYPCDPDTFAKRWDPIPFDRIATTK